MPSDSHTGVPKKGAQRRDDGPTDETMGEILVPEFMEAQLTRNGFMSKKTPYGSRQVIVQGKSLYTADSRTHTPDGSLIIHRNDADPCAGNCSAFIHPPYDSTQQYRGESSRDYCTDAITFEKLVLGAESCGFCAILVQGIQATQSQWIMHWVKLQWLHDHPETDWITERQQPWLVNAEAYDDPSKPISTSAMSTIRFNARFQRGRRPLLVDLALFEPSGSDASIGADRQESTDDDDAGRSKVLKIVPPPRKITTLEFYTLADFPNPWAAFGPSPKISPCMFSKDGLKKILTWLKDCTLNHEDCRRTLRFSAEDIETYRLSEMPVSRQVDELRKKDLPIRLVRGFWEDTPAPPKLVIVETAKIRERIRYMAVSHVWANTTPHKVTQATYETYQSDIPWSEISLSLRQALFVARFLGFDYVWIDSLCIIQDSTSDKQAELPRMSFIYEHASVVFAIHGPDLGVEREVTRPLRDPFRPDDALVYVRTQLSHETVFSAKGTEGWLSWFTRAWCMQERIFASRIIHFGGSREEAFFECNTEVYCECGQLQDDLGDHKGTETLKKTVISALRSAEAWSPDTIPVTTRDALWESYIAACEDYTERSITFSGDTLLAVSSLMIRFSPYLGEYYGGLWQYRLFLNLQWETSDTLRSHRHVDYVAPSFSWASRSGPVAWCFPLEDSFAPETHHFARLVDVSCQKTGDVPNPCGLISDGSITLEGRSCEMRVHEDKFMMMPDGRIKLLTDRRAERSEIGVGPDGSEGLVRRVMDRCWVTLDSREDYEELLAGQAVKCFELMRDLKGVCANFVSALAILPAKNGSSRYRRIGFSTMPEELFLGCSSEVITIV